MLRIMRGVAGAAARGAHHPRVLMGSRRPVLPGRVSPANAVPAAIMRPSYADGSDPVDVPRAQVHDEETVGRMRRAGAIAREMLQYAVSLVRPGITTDELDRLYHDECMRRGVYPSPLNYKGFPKSLCTSINEVMCHGIPDSRALEPTDIVNLDVTIFTSELVHADTSLTVAVDARSAPPTGLKLIEVANGALEKALGICKAGVPFSRIGRTIEKYVRARGFAVVPEFAGHGIAYEFHTPPYVFHFDNDYEGIMQAGMIFTIEPIVCQRSVAFHVLPDGWTAVATDGGLSAQTEHTVLVTSTGVEVLTGAPPAQAANTT